MREEELPQQNNEKLANKEKMLSNSAFKRFAGGFELYQELINREESSDSRNLIISRMRELYKPNLNKLGQEDGHEDETEKALRAALLELILLTLRECEEKKFDIKGLADKISASTPLYDSFSAGWNHKAGDIEQASGMIYANELYAYKIEDDDTISVHVSPSNTENKDISKKLEEGRRAVAEKLRNGELKANKIIMKSWLLSRERETITRRAIGNNIIIEDVPLDDEQYEAIQFLALQYNQQSLKKYLETGDKPEIRQVVMTKNEFLQTVNL